MKKARTKVYSIKRGTAIVLAVILCLQGVNMNVYASEITDEVKSPEIRRVNLNINGKIAGINDPSAPTDSGSAWSNGSGSRIWFGGNSASNFFNVLDSDADDFTQDGSKTLFVESNSYADMGNIIFDKEADNGQSAVSEWKNSDVYRYLNSVPGYGYLTTNFNTVERSVIVDSYNENHAEWTYDDDPFRYASLTGEKIFILDSMEARNEQYGFSSNRYNAKSRSRKTWWIRSSDISNSRLVGQVNANGIISSVNASTSKACCYPAMNIDLDSVFFSVAYSGGRPGMITYMESREQDKTWLLTIFDGNKDFDAELGCDSKVYADAPIKIKVNNLGTPQHGVIYDQISGMVVRNDGTVVAYGKIGEIDEDEFVFSLPKGVEPGEYTLKVFAEHAQHGRTTNYASNENDFHIIVSDKKVAPANAPDDVMEVANSVKSISDVPALPDGWEWDQNSIDTIFPQNGSIIVTAFYTADDKEELQNTEMDIEIRRQACVEGDILFTGDGDKLPTCTECGYGHTECSLCGDVIHTNVEVEPIGHHWEDDYTIDKEASCSEEGCRSIHCKNCDSIKDAECIEKSEHTPSEPVRENEVEASCSEYGSYDEVVYCSECGTEISRERKEIEKKTHIPMEKVIENEVDSDCHNKGSYDEVIYCSTCGEEIERIHKLSDTKDHVGGEAVKENEIESTCSNEGSYDLVVYCKECNEELSREKIVVEKKEHIHGEPVHENEITASCSAEGSYDKVIYCKDCGAEISRIHKVTDTKEHTGRDAVTENSTPATCQSEGGYDIVVYCADCGHELSRTHSNIEKLEHTPGGKVIENRVEATKDAEGSYDEAVYCTVCHTEISRLTFSIPIIQADSGDKKEESEPSQENDSDNGSKGRDDANDTASNDASGLSNENDDTQPTSPPSSDNGNKPTEEQRGNDDSSVSDNNASSTSKSNNSEGSDSSSSAGDTSSDDTSSGASSQPVSDSSSSQHSASSDIGESSLSGGQSGGLTPTTDSSTSGSVNGDSSVSGNTSTSASNPDDNSSADTKQESQSGTEKPQVDNGNDTGNQNNKNEESGVTASVQTESASSDSKPEKGSVIEDNANGNQYKVVSIRNEKGTVQIKSVSSKVKEVMIPNAVLIGGISYKVTGIADGAFKNNKKLKKVVIGKNITAVGKNAFRGCKKLKTITIKGKNIKKIGVGAFAGINKKAVIKVPKKKLGKYKKLLKKAKLSNKVKVLAY